MRLLQISEILETLDFEPGFAILPHQPRDILALNFLIVSKQIHLDFVRLACMQPIFFWIKVLYHLGSFSFLY
jgi:hypothetical protein